MRARELLAAVARDRRGRAKRLGRRLTVVPPRTWLQMSRVRSDRRWSERDRLLLRRMDSRIHPYEDMYRGDGDHYFSTAVSAANCIDRAVAAAGLSTPRSILDMPCGFGRVIRALVVRFPGARVTACDVRARAVRFCVRRFGAEGVVAPSASFQELRFTTAFDLVWCGSLLTHLPEAAAVQLLQLFARHVRDGVIVVTTHGEYVAELMRGGHTYHLDDVAAGHVLELYGREGFAFAAYPGSVGYGVALSSPSWVRRVAAEIGLREVYFAERDWDGHQDVFGFVTA